MSKIADCIESIERNAFQRTQRVQRCCGTCKYHQHEDVDDGWVCANSDSDNCTEWTEYNEMKIALEKATEKNEELMRELSQLARESVEREKNLARLEAEVVSACNSVRWIPVSERLPEDAYGCLLIVEDDDYFGNPHEVLLPYFAGYDGEQWNDGDGQRVPFEITHWMELPKPPEEGGTT